MVLGTCEAFLRWHSSFSPERPADEALDRELLGAKDELEGLAETWLKKMVSV